jgi:hypothetical protein
MSGVPGMVGTPRTGTGIDWAVARAVHTSGGMLGLLELSEYMGGVPRATLSRAVRRLELRGVVTVVRDQVDRRRITIRPGAVSASMVPRPNIASHQAQVDAS